MPPSEHAEGRWRRRLLTVLLLGLCLGALMAPFEASLQRSWPGRAASWVMTPFVVIVRGVFDGAAAVGGSFIGGRERRQRLAALEEEVAALRLENEQLRENNAALRDVTLAGLRYQDFRARLEAGRIVAFSTRWYDHSCVIDLGPDSGVTPGAVALTLDGVAGVVRRAGGGLSAVQLVTDRRFRAGARVEGSQAVGLLRGQGDQEELMFDTAGQRVSMSIGARIVTAGTEGSLFPEGLTLGYITAVEEDKSGKPVARVRPAAMPDKESRLFLLKNSGTVEIDWGELE